jgi:hypothetical protein
MRNRSSWLLSVIAVSVCAVIVVGAGLPSAFAAPKGKPPTTPPGVPPGQPFQALQKQIDTLGAAVTDLDARVDALEAAAPTAGLMWINHLAFVAVAGPPTLSIVAGPGLQVTAAAVNDAVQVGLQVPLGFAVKGAKVCYTATAAFNVQVLQDPVPPTSAALPLVTSLPGSSGPVVCVDTSLALPVDPSGGGAMSLGITLPTVASTVVIRAVGLYLEP